MKKRLESLDDKGSSLFFLLSERTRTNILGAAQKNRLPFGKRFSSIKQKNYLAGVSAVASCLLYTSRCV